MSLRNADLRDVLRSLGKVSKLEMIVDGDVGGVLMGVDCEISDVSWKGILTSLVVLYDLRIDIEYTAAGKPVARARHASTLPGRELETS